MNDQPELVVHILLMGSALCGQDGLPCDWPTHHKWVSAVHDPDIGRANCPGCIAKHKEMKHG